MATVEQTTLKVQRILTGSMGLRVQLDGDTMTVQFQDMSTSVRLRVVDWGEDADGEPRTVIRLAAPILWAVPPTPELFEWVAREGGDFLFGHVIATEDADTPDTVFLLMTHTLLGDYLDEPELASAMFGVLTAADELDDELQEKFGGKRLVDL